jgi:hypothetical protein
MSNEIDLRSAVIAGVSAGTAMLAFELVTTPLVSSDGPWTVLRRMAAIIAGPIALSSNNEVLVLFLAIVLHLTLSITYALLFEPAMRRMEPGVSILACSALACFVYVVNYHGLGSFFPWLRMARGGATLSAHMTFGAVMAAVYAHAHRRKGDEAVAQQKMETP